MCLESVVYFLLAIGIDVLLSYPSIRAAIFPDKDVPTKAYHVDSDVAAEAARVDAGLADKETIVLKVCVTSSPIVDGSISCVVVAASSQGVPRR
jgi:hypothetical protein